MLGIGFASWWWDLPGVDWNAYWPAAGNLAAFLWGLGGLTTLAANLTFRRGLAIACVIAIVVLAMTLAIVEPFVSSLKPFRFLSLMNYLKPVDVVREGAWPWADIMVLILIGVTAWLAGWILLLRRDVPTG